MTSSGWEVLHHTVHTLGQDAATEWIRINHPQTSLRSHDYVLTIGVQSCVCPPSRPLTEIACPFHSVYVELNDEPLLSDGTKLLWKENRHRTIGRQTCFDFD